MDKEQARFVLQSFRPDGADAGDPEFAEALALAAADRELGEWLAAERSQDGAFAEALAGIEIPDDLRASILAVLQGDAGPGDDSGMDRIFAEALAAVEPPAGLRDEILAAMQVGQDGGAAPVRRVSRWLKVAAVAAVLALGAGLAFMVPSGVNAAVVEREAIQFLESPFKLDLENERQADLYAFLASEGLPAPATVPAGLRDVRGVGCKELRFKGKPASLLCYMKEDIGVVHLVVLRRNDIAGNLPGIDAAGRNCKGCEVTGWSVATWSDEERAFLLLGKMDPAQLAAVF
ncbi:MAG: hypothetical protein HKN82_07385 [Akkermansiaceae bacterium]|nr:hypothetical protein [Akkermansiaceae bacterium]NNM30731.1 hypothetical protein [Akkermansiaceae bacterium]